MLLMSYSCYYCDHETESIHSITLYHDSTEKNELLCDECYDEWLASMKG
ncbi:MAG TPA: hypothetical protein VJ824_17290 [Bacillota bacterium]|nr:hypothetical protein [Bacillota bacterium]